jgi:hypothetical protein
MSTPDPATIAADAVRQRLVAVEAAYYTIVTTVGPFNDPDAVYQQIGNIHSLEMARRALGRAGLVKP